MKFGIIYELQMQKPWDNAISGVDQLILMVQAGRISNESCRQTIQLFGEEIIPAFK
ncbi:MAG: hypothetical protein IIB85_00930 [Chloroflexi bacterium]|nr:hypothetical protein [Chloroflexota bacterium]